MLAEERRSRSGLMARTHLGQTTASGEGDSLAGGSLPEADQLGAVSAMATVAAPKQDLGNPISLPDLYRHSLLTPRLVFIQRQL